LYTFVSHQGVFRNLSRGGLNFLLYRGAQHSLGHENPLKSIDFAGPEGGGLSPHRPPLYTPLYLIFFLTASENF